MKKKFPTSALTLITYLFLLTPVLKAGGIGPLWSKDLKSTVTWQKITTYGQLLACSGKGLAGLNPQSGEELWNLEELKNSPESSYEQIPNSPFISLSSASGRNSFFIVDPLAGKILFSAQAAGLEKITDKFFLYQNGKILVTGTSVSGKSTDLVMVDMATGNKLWSKTGEYSFTTGAKDLGNDEVLITSAFFASKINASTGVEIWKTAIDPKTAGLSNLLGKLEGFASKQVSKEEIMAQLIVPSMKPDLFLIAAQKKNESTKIDSKGNKSTSISFSSVYMAFDLATGKHVWPAVVEMQQPLGVSYPVNEGLLVSSGNSGQINMLQYGNGSRLLGKKGGGLSTKGPAAGMVTLNDGRILVVSDNGSNSSLTVLDPKSGQFTFEKAVKIKGLVSYTELLPGGVLVGTNEEVNLLHTGTGEWYFENAVTGGAGLIAGNEEKIYLFNSRDGLLYQLDVRGTALKPLSTVPLKFQGKEEPAALEINTSGILLTSDQNLAMFDLNGTMKFNNYFPAPGLSGFKKALLIASAVRAAYNTAVLATYSTAIGATSMSIQVKDSQSKLAKDVTGGVGKMLGEASLTGAKYTMAYIRMAQQRFTATTQTRDYVLVMTALSKKDIQLVQVSKSTGQVMNTISIGKDKDPVYDVDLVEGKLYYMKSPSIMECYQF